MTVYERDGFRYCAPTCRCVSSNCAWMRTHLNRVGVLILLLATTSCRILGLTDPAVKFGTTFVTYGMVYTSDDPPVWAGVRVTFAIRNEGGAAITLFDTTLEQEIDGVWRYAISNPRGGVVGGLIIQPGQSKEVTELFRASPGEPKWPGATIAGRYRLHAWVSDRYGNVVKGPMGYTAPFTVVE